MARFTEASKQALIEGMDAVAVVQEYLRLEKKSGRYWGLCPFHQEKTPSFTVDPEKKTYYCFGCHKGGSIVGLVMDIEKISFPEAMETLSKLSGIPLIYESGFYEQKKEQDKKTEELADLYKRVTTSFNHILMKTKEGERAKSYIMDRGIGETTIERFGLGFAPADRYWMYKFLVEKGFSEEFLANSGLFSRRYPKSAFFSNRLIFPISDKNGKIIAFGGRLLEGEGPKYINSSDSELFKKGRTIFALDIALPEIRRTKEVYLTEGYMDVLALYQAGVSNAVAPLGTAFTDDQAKLLGRWAEKVYIFLDNDDAGQNAVYKTILCCRRNKLNCLIIDIQGFFDKNESIPKDPAEILQKYGPEALKNSIKRCIFDFDFLLSRSRAFKEVSRAVAFLFPYLDVLVSEVDKEESIKAISDAFELDRQSIWEDYNRTKPARAEYKGAENTVSTALDIIRKEKRPFRAEYELYLMGAVFANPVFFKRLRSGILPEDLEDTNARELYFILEEWYRENGPFETIVSLELMDKIQDKDIRDFILRQEALGAFSNPEKLINDGMKKITSKILEKQRKNLIRELRNTTEGIHRQTDLLAEKVYIDEELSKLR